ncbi:MAG: ribbon-helix-helix protein, CopG family [Proteobacteria bacterium]|nr:ribbon-helix-helix protein, CopG family [Pseudomonadota bacterium]
MAEIPTRPGPNEEVTIDLPSSLLATLDQWAAQAGISRTQAIRQLLESALQRFKAYAPIKDPE